MYKYIFWTLWQKVKKIISISMTIEFPKYLDVRHIEYLQILLFLKRCSLVETLNYKKKNTRFYTVLYPNSTRYRDYHTFTCLCVEVIILAPTTSVVISSRNVWIDPPFVWTDMYFFKHAKIEHESPKNTYSNCHVYCIPLSKLPMATKNEIKIVWFGNRKNYVLVFR